MSRSAAERSSGRSGGDRKAARRSTVSSKRMDARIRRRPAFDERERTNVVNGGGNTPPLGLHNGYGTLDGIPGVGVQSRDADCGGPPAGAPPSARPVYSPWTTRNGTS